MKVVWVVNIILPDLSEKLNIPKTVIGGWLHQSAASLKERIEELTIVTTKESGETEHYEINGIHYYLIPTQDRSKYDKSLEPNWKDIFNTHKPDVLHIHGTEFSHGLSALKVFDDTKTAISIQGLVGVYARYYRAALSLTEIIRNITFRDIIKGSIIKEQRNFFEKGKIEIEYIKKAKHIIGRTDWDYIHTKTINKNSDYHFCNETLREKFYASTKWNIQNKEKFKIFLSQAGYPIKGLHQVLKAVHLLKDEFPQIKIVIGGHSIINNQTWKDKLKINGYGKYILTLIKKYNLQKNVEFLGLLDADRMIDEYLYAHVFICPSSIENSPNSVGESQILGTPVIASYVGGTPNMIQDGVTGLLYRFEEVEMLAYNIRRIFNDDALAQNLSYNGIQEATKRHSLKTNMDQLLTIYDIINQKM